MAAVLPGGLAPPLRILTPFPWGTLFLLAALVALLAFLIYRRRRQRRRPPPESVPVGQEIQASDPISFDSRLQRLADRHRRVGSFREGCHELVELVRTRWFESGDARPRKKTALEIGETSETDPVAPLLRDLARLRFGEQAPSEEEFGQAVKETAAAERRFLKRKVR